VYDVQIRRAGSSVWQYFRQGTTMTSAVFTPDAGVGTYSFQARIRLVANGRAAAFSTPVSIDVGGNLPPVPVIDLPSSGFTWHVGESIDFAGHATDPEDGSMAAASLSWDVVVQDCSSGTCVATPYQSIDGQASGSFAAPDHAYPVSLDLELTATDSGGLAVSTTIRLEPETTEVTMVTDPPGLQLGIGSRSEATPFTHTVIVGSTQSITAPSPQSLASTPYEFVSWSDGAAQTHDVVVNEPTTYTATFQASSVSMITVSDFLFQPKNAFPPIGGEVRWTFAGPSTHTVTDNTGMGLYDSGSQAPGGSYSFAFISAGNFPFRCTIHPTQMRGSVQIPVSVSPSGGQVDTPFSITWASGAPPAGYVYDVQIRRPGSSVWQYFRQSVTMTSAVFTPDAGVGTYSFQARIRLVANGRAAAFSTPVSIDVT
jgi:plastocyanin